MQVSRINTKVYGFGEFPRSFHTQYRTPSNNFSNYTIGLTMPALGAVDPADLRAQARAELGLSRELAQPRRVKPHPRKGGSSGYPDRRTTTTPARRG
jgi:hypothetical protein